MTQATKIDDRARRRRSARAILAIMTIQAAVGAPVARADTALKVSSNPTWAAGVVSDGTHIHTLGGESHREQRTDARWRYIPPGGNINQQGRLPSARSRVSAVHHQGTAFVFGGDDGRTLDEIVAFDTTDRTNSYVAPVVSGARLPSPRLDTSAVSDGKNAYIIGGRRGSDLISEIVRFDLAARRISTMRAKLPAPTSGTSAIFDGKHAYVFGGLRAGGSVSDEIYRFDPAGDSITKMTARLPSGAAFTSAAFDGTYVYIFGGFGAGSSYLSRVLRFHPATDRIVTMTASLPTGRAHTGAAWFGNKAYVVGGYDGTNVTAEVIAYTPSPGPPSDLQVRASHESTRIELNWSEPDANSYTGTITGYRIYRRVPRGTTTQIGRSTSTGFTDRKVEADLVYEYAVSAENASGEGGMSAFRSARALKPDSVKAMPGLNFRVAYPSAVLHPSANILALVIGGWDGADFSRRLVRVTPQDSRTPNGADSRTLPTGRRYTSAVIDGTVASVFGGYDGRDVSDEILSFSVHGTVGSAKAKLPTGRSGTSAASDGTYAYVIGGLNGRTFIDEIVRYDRRADTAEVVARLPAGLHGTSAVWTGSEVLIFGGGSGGGLTADILRFNPSDNTVTKVGAKLPSARSGTSAIWDGGSAYIFGGQDGGAYLNQIVRYDPAADTVTAMSAALPSGRAFTAAVWDGTYANVFGGYDGKAALGDVIRYTPVAPPVLRSIGGLPPSDEIPAGSRGSSKTLPYSFGILVALFFLGTLVASRRRARRG